jgi:hypothetical protein
MKKLTVGLLLLVGFNGWGQVSVFDCNNYTKTLTQTKLDANSNFFNSCFEMGINNSVTLQDNADKTIKATSQIHLKDSVHIGAFSTVGQTHLLISDSTDFDVVVMNYDSLDEILRYKKLEFGIPLPADINDKIANFINETGADSLRLNPFLEWDIDVEASFYSDNAAESVNGFYTREYEQNNQTHDWDDIGTDYPFRIRFAPPKNGEWKAQVVINVNGQFAYKSNIFFFNVVESGDPGYVQVHENNANLKRGNRMIFPVGQNFPSPDEPCLAYRGSCYYTINDTMLYDTVWSANGDSTFTLDTLYYGHNLYFPDSNTTKVTNIVAWNSYLEMLEQYLQTPDGGGPKYFRTVQMAHSSLLEFEEKGNYYDRLHYAAETDKILELCEEYDALFMFNFMMQEPIMKFANYGKKMWDWDYYQEDGNLPLSTEQSPWNDPVYCYNDEPSYVKSDNTIHVGTKKPYEMFTDESDLAYHKQRTRYYIARYGYSTKIYAFEILSEPWHLGEAWSSGQGNQGVIAPFLDPSNSDHDSTRFAINNYHKVISEYIKDSLNHNKHLIGFDMADELGSSSGGLDASVMLSSIDFVGFNPYYSVPNALIKSNSNNMNGYVHKININRIIDEDSIIGYTVIYGDSFPIYKPTGLVPLPVIISEGGTDESYMECSNFDLDIVDKMTLPFTGVAGINTWLGYRPNNLKDENDVVTMPNRSYDMWNNTIRVKNHMNGNDVINTLSEGGGYWSHGMEYAEYKKQLRERYSVEHQYYISSDKSNAVGYVKNRSFNVKTRSLYGSLCYNVDFDNKATESPRNTEWKDVKKSERLRINNLKTNTEYKIDWYSSNQYIKPDCIETNKKNGNWGITLEYPELTVSHTGSNDLPVVWYVVYQQPCNSGMAQQDNIEEAEEGMSRTKILSNNRNFKQVLNVYPNPFNNFISIRSPQKDQMVLKSVEGKVVGNYEIEKGQSRVNTDNLSSGMYILTFKSQNKSFKLIKR